MKRLMLAVAALCAQSAAGGNLTVWFKGGIRVRMTTEIVPGGKAFPYGGSVVVASSDVVHRLLADGKGGIKFAYDLEAERTGTEFRLRVKPLVGKSAEQIWEITRWARIAGGTPADGPIPTFDAPREIGGIREGDRVAVDLLSNPDTGEKLVDILQVTHETPLFGEPTAVEEIVLDRVSIAIRTNVGEQHWVDKDKITGAAALIYIPRLGAFLLSLEKPAAPGFEPSGIAENQRLTFVWNGALIEVASQSNILRKSAFGRVWVKHDPGFKPADGVNSLSLMTADKIDYLMRK